MRLAPVAERSCRLCYWLLVGAARAAPQAPGQAGLAACARLALAQHAQDSGVRHHALRALAAHRHRPRYDGLAELTLQSSPSDDVDMG